MVSRSDQPSGLAPILLLLILLVLLGSGGLNPSPGPGPNPPPETSRALMLLIVEETGRRTPALADLLLSAELRAGLLAASPEHRLRIVDQDAVEWDGSPARVLAPWRALPALPGGGQRALPWALLVSSDGRVLSEGPLQSSVAEVVSWVRQHTSFNRVGNAPRVLQK